MTEDLNERNFDRMVDGELDDEEQARLLLACEEDPAQWRSLALAYVESQAWRADLLKIRDELQEQTKAKPAATERRHRLPIKRLLNIAAMLMLSLTIGVGVGAFSFKYSSDQPSPSLASQPTTSERTPSQSKDEIFVLVHDQETSELQPMKVPLVDLSDVQAGLGAHHPIPTDVWRSLQDHGHDVSHLRQWYSVRLNDGRNALVPVDNVRVMFEGFQ